MKDIDEMFKDILKDDNNLEVILSTILESDKPILINIFLGDD